MQEYRLLAALVLVTPPAPAQECGTPIAIPAGLTPGAAFGNPVGLSANHAIVGASRDGALGVDAGAAVLYELNQVSGSVDVMTIARASDGAAGDYFGTEVAIDGDVAVVGSWGRDTLGIIDSGAAYVFRLAGGAWVEEQRLTSSSPGQSQHFGRSIDVSGDRIAVGQGNSCDVFHWVAGTWVLEAVLGTDGTSVSLDGGVLASRIGAYGYNPVTNTWALELSRNFGSFSLDGDFLYSYPGGITLERYRRNPASGTWTRLSSSNLPSATPIDFTLGDNLFASIIGQVFTVSAVESGQHIMLLFGLGQGDLSCHSGRVLVGRYHTTGVELIDLRCGNTLISWTWCLQTTPNSTGNSARCWVAGSSIVVDNDATLFATVLPPDSIAYFIVSRQGVSLPGPGSSIGTLCVGAAYGRFDGPGEIQSTGPYGRLQLRIDLNALPTATGTVAAAAGESWYFQCWYRDVNPVPTSAFSDGAVVDWQ